VVVKKLCVIPDLELQRSVWCGLVPMTEDCTIVDLGSKQGWNVHGAIHRFGDRAIIWGNSREWCMNDKRIIEQVLNCRRQPSDRHCWADVSLALGPDGVITFCRN
jgi:hypothetical protein